LNLDSDFQDPNFPPDWSASWEAFFLALPSSLLGLTLSLNDYSTFGKSLDVLSNNQTLAYVTLRGETFYPDQFTEILKKLQEMEH
jgi:hypothetical protein